MSGEAQISHSLIRVLELENLMGALSLSAVGQEVNFLDSVFKSLQ